MLSNELLNESSICEHCHGTGRVYICNGLEALGIAYALALISPIIFIIIGGLFIIIGVILAPIIFSLLKANLFFFILFGIIIYILGGLSFYHLLYFIFENLKKKNKKE